MMDELEFRRKRRKLNDFGVKVIELGLTRLKKKGEARFCCKCSRPIAWVEGCGFLLEDLTPEFLQSGVCVNCVKKLVRDYFLYCGVDIF